VAEYSINKCVRKRTNLISLGKKQHFTYLKIFKSIDCVIVFIFLEFAERLVDREAMICNLCVSWAVTSAVFGVTLQQS